MNDFARMIVSRKLGQNDSARSDSRDMQDMARDMANDMRNSYTDGYRDGYERAAYEIRGQYDSESDGARRRSKTTGRYMRDSGEHLQLKKHDITAWEEALHNADGTKGKHFSAHQVEEAANKLGIRFDHYSEKELCMTMNMLYSDLCEVNRPFVSPEKEAHYYAKLAQAWLEDDDGPSPSEKLALYYYCIADE